MKHLAFYTFLCMAITACQKDNTTPLPKPKYTIQGRVFLNYPNAPYTKQGLTITVTRGSNGGGFGNNYVSKDLASVTTNDSGWFSATYEETDITGDGGGFPAQIHIYSQFLEFDGLPVNQNINQNFYHPLYGKVQVYLRTNNPLENNHDTLYLGHYAGKIPIIDTVIHNINGLYKTYTASIAGFSLYYGRGWKQFAFNPQTGYFANSQHQVGVSVHGDPIIDTMSINY